MALTFDTHDAIRKLRGKGHSESQAEGIVEFVSDATGELLTRDYFQTTMEHFEARMDARYGSLRAELDARYGSFRAEMDARDGRLRAELYRVALIQGGIITGAVVALVKLL